MTEYMDETQDARYNLADAAICEAFLLLLKDKELEKISVADVIKKAGIVRSTFYNHYENIPALVNAVEDRTIRDIFTLMGSFRPQSDWDICHSFFLSVCEYTAKNPFLAGILRSPRGDAFLEKAMTMFHRYVTGVIRTWAPRNGERESQSYMIAAAIGSALGVLHKWTVDDFRVPPGTVADILTRSFMAGFLPNIQ